MPGKYIIISGTNRKDSNTIKVAVHYQEALAARDVSSEIISLEELDLSGRTSFFVQLEQEVLIPAEKFILSHPNTTQAFPEF